MGAGAPPSVLVFCFFGGHLPGLENHVEEENGVSPEGRVQGGKGLGESVTPFPHTYPVPPPHASPPPTLEQHSEQFQSPGETQQAEHTPCQAGGPGFKPHTTWERHGWYWEALWVVAQGCGVSDLCLSLSL